MSSFFKKLIIIFLLSLLCVLIDLFVCLIFFFNCACYDDLVMILLDWNLFADVTIEAVYSLARKRIGQKKPTSSSSANPLAFEMQQTTPKAPAFQLECSICHRYFNNIRNFKRHYTEKHAMSSLTKFPCPNCDKSYVHKKHLVYHMTHECGAEPKHKCPYCDHRTKYKSALNEHIKSLHQEKKITFWTNLFYSVHLSSLKEIHIFSFSCLETFEM